ncbi:helix-turn-helix domain-containing protein [Brevibacillus laterosporus]|uniref:helix-turn-helix domain-containing protein n=1 Tax=Brevibacillus laterosporus TaxID=1465 RepID=UPI003D239885
MVKKKLVAHYWLVFDKYQTFDSVESLFDAVSSIQKNYDLSPAVEAVLNTLKLHSQHFFGVCWLKVAEIANKAGVHVRTVHRVLKALKDAGVISVYSQVNTRRGGKAPNVYVINPVDNVDSVDNSSFVPSSGISDDISPVTFEDTSDVTSDESPKAAQAEAEQSFLASHNSSNKDFNSVFNKDFNTSSDSNKTINRNNRVTIPENFNSEVNEMMLKDIPYDFVRIFKPFYAKSPEIILARWKTACQAVKNACQDWMYTSWQTVKEAWLQTVYQYKKQKLRDDSDNGMGGYFYSVLVDKCSADYIAWHRENVWEN